MAQFGACHPVFKPDGKTKGFVLGKLVSANLTVQLASGEISADDSLAEQLSEFVSGTIAEATDDLEDAVISELYGCQIVDGTVVYNIGDTAPRGMHGYYKTLMRNGKKFYKTYIYPQVRAALGNDNAQTKGTNITFAPTDTTFTVFADDEGAWRKTKVFTTAAAATAYLDKELGVAEYHEINVTVQGAGTGKSVDQVGTFYVPNGDSFKLAIEGTPTALYDNAVDKKTAMSGKAYTISNVTGPHSVAVIFAS